MTLEGSKTVPIKELNGQQMILHRHVRKTKAPRCKNVVKKAQDKRALVQKSARLMDARQKSAGQKGTSQKSIVLKNAG